MSKKLKIIWTKIDEAPALATYSFFPILKAFTSGAGFEIEMNDISLSGRILANFPDYLREEQKIPDYLKELGEKVFTEEINIIKLPNISASIPQLKSAIKELQKKKYQVPDFPDEPQTNQDKKLRERYSKILGSAVNPVLRQGNSDRRAPASVKEYARKHPELIGFPLKNWNKDSKTHVVSMTSDDFYQNEISTTIKNSTIAKIIFDSKDGSSSVLKEKIQLAEGEIIDATSMNISALCEFYEQQINEAKDQDLLLSLHMKATMMKVSDPIIFGHCVKIFYKPVIQKYAAELKKIGFIPNNGIDDLYSRLNQLSDEKAQEISDAIKELYKIQPKLAMVDSSRGITNLHVPNDMIIDASMPVMIRDGGKMWGSDGELHETKAMIPDRCYASIYQAVIEDCKENGIFDRAKMGSVSNIGLMAQKAEEYGSHDKTFEAVGEGVIKVVDSDGKTLLKQKVEAGDIFRMCQLKDAVVKDWVRLAVERMKISGSVAIFWLDKERAHDAELIKKVNTYISEYDLSNLDYRIMSPLEAVKFTLNCIRKGEDIISVTGNVLRDYLTDLFPILELGISAKMLSIVPLLNGGGLFETGAGGSAPKHVEQFLKENHLRWDSLGEFSALVASFEHLGNKFDNLVAKELSKTLDKAIGVFLENRKSPSNKVGELDTRGSHYYLALYWSEELAKVNSPELRVKFESLAKKLRQNEKLIIEEITEVQGSPVDIGGYYKPDDKKAEKTMRPSKTLNSIIDSFM